MTGFCADALVGRIRGLGRRSSPNAGRLQGPGTTLAAGLNERAGAGEVHEGRLWGPAVKLRFVDARRPLLPRIKRERESLVRENAVRTRRHELSAPRLPTRAQIRDGDVHLHV